MSHRAIISQQSLFKELSKDKEYLIRFLQTLPQMESHYCRKDTTKLYLETQLQNLNELYRFYYAECSRQNCQAINRITFRRGVLKAQPFTIQVNVKLISAINHFYLTIFYFLQERSVWHLYWFFCWHDTRRWILTAYK